MKKRMIVMGIVSTLLKLCVFLAFSYAGNQTSSIRLQVPTSKELREDLKDSPHSTPASIFMFSSELSSHMDQALKSPKIANQLFGELLRCALTGTDALSIQAICVKYARVLGEKYASLHPSVESLMSKIKPEVLALLPTKSAYQETSE